MIKHGHVSVTALVTGTILSGLALSACQRSATNTAAVDPNAAAPAVAPAYSTVAPPTVRYVERPRRREDEDERAYAARLASDAAYQARLQQAAADRARYGQQRVLHTATGRLRSHQRYRRRVVTPTVRG